MAKTLLYNNISPTGTLTPESIMESLFTFRDIAHKFHLNCFITKIGSFAEHKALDKLYKGLQDLQDSILEEIMGYTMTPANSPVTSIDAPSYTGTSDSISLCNRILDFAKSLQNYARSNSMSNIENLSQELSGLAAQTRYFLMFK